MSVRRWQRTLRTGKRSWRWVVDIAFRNDDGSCTRIRKFPREQTRVAAERLERDLLAKIERPAEASAEPAPSPESPAVPTLSEFWHEYFSIHAVTNNKPSEQAAKESIFRRHLAPVFGDVRLDHISARTIERFKAHQFSRLGYAPKTVNNHLAVLRGALRVAREWGLIQRVPRYRELRAAEQTMRFLTAQEASRLILAAEGQWRVMAVVALNTGLRIGELLGLQWTDVDLLGGLLVVRRNIWRNQIGSPKSGRTREVALNEAAKSALREHPRQAGPWVFNRQGGAHLTNAACRRPLHRACKKAGLEPFQWHVLRHTFASHLVTAGVPLRAIQRLLGHANHATTERYAHLLPQTARSAVALLSFDDGSPTAR